MKKIFSTIALLIAAFLIPLHSIAQEKLRSTKLLKDTGIEELYQIASTDDGFIGIGLKGNDALQKKLWLIRMDPKMQVISSEILSNQALTDPFKILSLPNGNTLILAQLDQQEVKKSILFCMNNKMDMIWAKAFDQNSNMHLLDMCLTANNEIVFAGKQYLQGQLSLESDQLVVIKTSASGDIRWQKMISMGHSELKPGNIFVDPLNNIIINGTITQVDNIKSYTKSWFALKLDAEGKLNAQIMVNGFANYNYATNIIPYQGGYMVAINNSDYFGRPAVAELTSDLKVKNSFTLEGSPMLISGITLNEHKLIIAGVFSNTFNDYAPGFVLLNTDKNITVAKSSPSLFKHFFITNILNLPDEQFMLSGIGYNEKEASDVYMLPFTSDGNSACNLNTHNVSKQSIDLKTAAINDIAWQKSTVTASDIKLEKSAAGYEVADICTAPDDNIIDPSDNTSWAQWKKNNQSAFTIKVPTDWLEVLPNPSHDKVTVTYKGMAQTDALRLTIISSEGKMVMNNIIRNQDIFDIDISMLANGTYYFNLYDGKETQVKKVVKQ